jgi:hypothetical protein
MIHWDSCTRSSGNNSSEPEILSTPSDQGSKKRRLQSIPRQERLAKKSKKSEKEMSIDASREMQKKIEEKSIIVLDLGSSSHEADLLTTVKIDVTTMVSGSEYRAMMMCRVIEHKCGGRDWDIRERQCIVRRGQSCDKECTWPMA